MSLRINFFGGPGVGKSVLAARVYAELSRAGIVTTELVREFVKPWAYEGKKPDAFDQVYTFANQLWSEHRLFKAGVDVIVTDSPLLLQCVYASALNKDLGIHLRGVAFQYEEAYPSVNFLVDRIVPFRRIGRFQDESELGELDARIQAWMDNWRLPYLHVNPDDHRSVTQTVREAVYSQE